MTNKPMLSVERELLEAMHSHPDCPVEFIDHLRRAINQPAGNAFKRCTILKECSTIASATTASAQRQVEPVALQHMAVSEGGVLRWMTGRKMQDCELYAMPDGSAIRSKLYAEQPAPVMPDVDALAQIIRKVDGSHTLGAGSLAEAILGEVAKLNGVKT